MEKVQEFFKSPKKTAILGLISLIIYLCYCIHSYCLFSIKGNIIADVILFCLSHITIICLIIYFIIVLMRFYKKKGNIKFANYMLITCFIIGAIVSILNLVIKMKYLQGFDLVYYAISILINTSIAIYFISILIYNKTNISNKLLILIFIIYWKMKIII